MTDKNQRPLKTAPDKLTNGFKKNKNSQPTKLTITKRKLTLDSGSSEDDHDDHISSSSKTKIQQKVQKKGLNNKPKAQPPPLVRLVQHDELQEFNDFMENKNKNETQNQDNDKKENAEAVEEEKLFKVFKKESKNLSKLAFGLFDGIKLKLDGVRAKIAPSTKITNEENKIEIENDNSEKETPKMEIEASKENTQKLKRFIDLLRENNSPEEIFDIDRIKNISFEPVKEPVKSTEMEIEPPIAKKQQTQTESNKDKPQPQQQNSELYIPKTVSIDHTQENYDNLSQIVEDIKEIDFQRLEPDVYLNDTLMNFYFKLVEMGFLNNERKEKVHVFNTYFMPKMRSLFEERDNDFTLFKEVRQKMEKWTKRVNILQKDFLLIPVNDNEHWNMAILCYPQRLYSSQDDEFPLVVYLDSISRMESIYSRMVYEFFAYEMISRRNADEALIQKKLKQLKSMGFPHYQPMVPKQNNLTDCGLYLLQYVELFAESEEYILNNRESDDKTKWFPKELIAKKREDMKKLIICLRSKKWKGIKDYLEARNRRIEKYSKFRDQYDSFNQKEFEKALRARYKNAEKLGPDELRFLKLDFYYLDTLENEE